MKDTVLIIGNGGREHAILDRLVLSETVEKVLVCNNTYWNKPFYNKPEYSKVKNHTLDDTSVESYVKFAKKHKVGLCVVGTETFLADGIVDEFNKHNIMCFGPTKSQAMIESSKLYGKDIMRKLALPTAEFGVYSDKECLKKFLRDNIANDYQVIKKNGLAAGKGVLVLKDGSKNSLDQGLEFIDKLYEDDEFSKVLIEKKLSGIEVSVLAFCNGKKAYLMPAARDFKRIYDGDIGSNTGGMGAICPGDLLDDIQLEKMQSYMNSVVEHMNYKGVLYAGLMVRYEVDKTDSNRFNYKNGYYIPGDVSKIHFLEFNCRFGDPETQSILPLLSDSCDLYNIMCKCMLGHELDEYISWKENMKSVNVVLSHIEYPYGKLNKAVPIEFNDSLKRFLLWNKENSFHMNVSNVSYNDDKEGPNNGYYTTGGRVLSLATCSTNFMKCFTDIYSMCKLVNYENIYYRMDIGKEYLIGFNRDNRINHWHGFDILNVPTLAVFHDNKNTVDRVKAFIEFLDECKTSLAGMLRIGLIVCVEKEYELMELSSKYKIPLLFVDEKLNNTTETRTQVIETLRSFHVNMIISTDNFKGLQDETKLALFEEYGQKMFDVSVECNLREHSYGHLKYIICHLRNYFNMKTGLKSDIHTFQFVNPTTPDKFVATTKNNNMCYGICFAEYLKFYNQTPLKYRVDIDGGNDFVDYLKKDNKEIGDFCFKYLSGSDEYGLATDGVGTKLDLALKYKCLDTIGTDLVAMSVNDLYVHGVKPTYFLDYLAIDKMDVSLCKNIVNSIRSGCELADCNLVGGETAEMRGMYRSKKCDLGGFAVGKCVDTGCNNIDGRRKNIEPGCLLFGLPSSGFHSNGFTLVNDFVHQCYLNAELEDKYSILCLSDIKNILAPTRIYNEIPDILMTTELKDSILGIAHITGGGFSDNVQRVLCHSEYKNDGKGSPLSYELNFELNDMFDYLSEYAEENEGLTDFREVIKLYKWTQKITRCSMDVLFRTFNCGIGMVFVMKKGVNMGLFEKYGYNEFIPLGEVIDPTE